MSDVNADALGRRVKAATKQPDCWETHTARSVYRNDGGENVCVECIAATLGLPVPIEESRG